MTNIEASDRALIEFDLADTVIAIEPRPGRREFWIPCVAALSAIVVVGGMLLILTAELRAGWVPGHELPMDKATAIHKLLFRS
ncbi:MAG TPA: hypothetical protein VGF92_22580 [Stellaceae bacterium]|jgi:hypothetical protein